ncbi:MAG: hypothetical protein WBE72_05715 [Terracidiphilus sp.]
MAAKTNLTNRLNLLLAALRRPATVGAGLNQERPQFRGRKIGL